MRPLALLAWRRTSASCFGGRLDVSKRSCHSSVVLPNNIIRSKYDDVPLSRTPYFDFLWENAKQNADRIALVDGHTGQTMTYAESHQASKNFGAAMKWLGAKQGDVMALLLSNCFEFPIVFSGASYIGVTTTTMNPAYTPKEIAHQIKMSGARWAVVNHDLVPVMKASIDILEREGVFERGDWRDRIFVIGEPIEGCLSVDDLMTRVDDEDHSVTINVDKDILVLPYSSGTTGLPKGVMLSHFNVVANICQQMLGPPEIRICEPAKDDFQEVTLCVLPLYHIYALNVTMGPLLWSGGKMVFIPKFEPKDFLKTMLKYKPTFLHVAPPLLSFCVNHHDVTDKHFDSLNYVLTAAAPTGPALYQMFKKRAPNVTLREGWGMSETSPIGLIAPKNRCIVGSCGVNVPNTLLKVVDVKTGEALGPNQRGEICLKGPQVMQGYLNNEKATAETIQDGWLHSGDIAYYDENGHIYIVDRIKELIKVKGFQVPPAELEDLLRQLPEIHDVAVIGIPHERFGEAPRAYVVVKPGAAISADEIKKYVDESTVHYKHLSGGIEFVNVIPKSASGKILRRELRDKFMNELNGKAAQSSVGA